MDDYKTLSLCVSIQNKNDQQRLYRVADVNESNELIPYNSYLQPGMLFNPHIPPAGSTGFWEWYQEQGSSERYRTYPKNGKRWIEHILLKDVDSLEKLRIALSEGIEIDAEFVYEHDYLIEFSDSNDDISSCVYCRGGDFSPRDNKYVLCDGIYRLDAYDIQRSRLHVMQSKFLPDFNKRYYGNLVLPQSTGSVLVRTPSETIRQAIIKRINRCSEGFSKDDKRIIKNFLQNLSFENVVDQIAAECKCSEQEAREYIDEFVKCCELNFGDDDFCSSIMLRLVEYNSEIGVKYQQTIKDEWERENSQLIKESESELSNIKSYTKEERRKANAELSELQNSLKILLSECEEFENTKNEITQKIAFIQKEYDDKLKLADGIAEQIRVKISEAKDDVSSFLAEHALYTTVGLTGRVETGTASISSDIIGKVDNRLTFGSELTAEPENFTEIKDVLTSLKENLESIGVDRTLSSALGAFLLSAYFAKVPLIISGINAHLILDALSATLFNRTAHNLNIDGNQITSKIQAAKGIIAVQNGFSCMDLVLKFAGNAYACFVSQTSEELILEPRSAYNYALPIFTEYFVTSGISDTLYGTLSEVQYNDTQKGRKPLLPKYSLPPLAYSNCKMILGIATHMYREITPLELMLLSDCPIMLSLGKREELLELISVSKLSDNDRERLHCLIGEKL